MTSHDACAFLVKLTTMLFTVQFAFAFVVPILDIASFLGIRICFEHTRIRASAKGVYCLYHPCIIGNRFKPVYNFYGRKKKKKIEGNL